MSDALPFPSRPNLEYYKKLAKEMLEAKAGSGVWERIPKPDSCKLTDAQFALARTHGFASWPKFSKHVAEMERANSPVSQFESAVDAIVVGDVVRLTELLSAAPDLVRARSTREHRSTLLHYVSANGVEGFRQKTPPQIVEITRVLLDSGADVNAESDAYAGHSTTLMLTGTSCHPEYAGLQIPLMELLVQRGARFDGRDVVACLHNGRGQAARWLADRGAKLDLEGAAGVGLLDRVIECLADASPEDKANALAWASQFDRPNVVEYLLDHGVSAARFDTQPSPLHWAALAGSGEIVRMLLAHQAPVNISETRFDGTPLSWAIHGWSDARLKREGHYEAIALLVKAGADHPKGWRESDKVKGDARMLSALEGYSAQS